MKKICFYLTLLIFTGCTANPLVPGTKVEPVANTCPEKPISTLEGKDVRSISLSTSGVTKESGQLQASKSLGYTFEAQSGQKLTYQTRDDVCIWIFAPDNKLLSNTDLPQSGKYVLQVAALKGSITFNLEMSLGSLAASPSPSPISPPASPISPAPASPEPVYSTAPTVSRPSPEQAVRDYYSKINNRQYQAAWDQLSPKFRREKSEDSYSSFVTWWNKVRQVEVQGVRLISKGSDAAIVETSISYSMLVGKDFSHVIRIYFVWNESTGLWTFNDTDRRN